MKKALPYISFFHFFILTFLFCQGIAAATVTRYNGSRIYWDARNPVTIFNSGGYARLIELSDGRLMACCESGGIKVSFSTNKGRTWSSSTLIAPNTNNTPNCVPDLVQLSDGTIIVGYNPRPSKPYTEDRRFGIRVRRSTDNGKSWSDEIFVYDADYTFENGCWEPSFLELPSGELQLYFADESPYMTTSEQQISLCRSFDGGLTWSEPQRVSYRSGYRDGMPVPVLLSDQRTIVVAIEDNGWEGVGDFVPTTVRVPLTNNWKSNFYVSGSSNQRNRCVNHNYCPVAKGGAPYLRVLPGGETVLSHQSTYGEGDNMKMYVYVGNKQAKDFKAMSRPFLQGTTKGCWWNSLAVIDTGIVVAVGGLDGKVVMMKGYPMNQFLAPYGSQMTDGRLTSDDTYYNSTARQVPMGNETGAFSYIDFAYDNDMLYMTCLVYRNNPRSEEPFPDGVTFYVESKGASTNIPMPSAYRFNILPNSTLTVSKGNGTDWKQISLPTVRAESVVSSSNYRIEIEIPWTALDLSTAPVGENISVNMEIVMGDGTQQQVELIPDANPLKPATWVPLKLIEPDPTGIGDAPRLNDKGQMINDKDEAVNGKWSNGKCYDLSGRRISNFHPFNFSTFSGGIYIQDGKKFAWK
ncbi:MAG: exo-alpha-sialidase [Bacteroidaceae bacterium]|nr:exo-alpha-sialidase [Bacteroidaceae bacterium]